MAQDTQGSFIKLTAQTQVMNGLAVALQVLVDRVSLEIRLQFSKIIYKRKILFWILKRSRITKNDVSGSRRIVLVALQRNRPLRSKARTHFPDECRIDIYDSNVKSLTKF